MEIIRRMLIREVPAFIDEYDDADKNESAFWKNKKWCCHITHRIFERYGSPGNVDEQYTGTQFLRECLSPKSSSGYENLIFRIRKVLARKLLCSDVDQSATVVEAKAGRKVCLAKSPATHSELH